MTNKETLIEKNPAGFERFKNRDKKLHSTNMIMPGYLQDNHKEIDPEKGIPASRRQFNQIFLLLDGIHDIHLDADYRWLKPNDLVIVPENMLYASTIVRNCEGYTINFKTEYIQPLLKEPISSEFPFFETEAEHIINISAKENEAIQQSFRDIINEYHRISPEKDYLLRNYVYILLLRIREIYRPYIRKIRESLTKTEKLAIMFRHRVEKKFITMRHAAEYAEEFHLSVNYLSDAVREVFGKSPEDLINDMLLLEVIAQLNAADKTVSEIAYELNFFDLAHLNQFMKQLTGLTPIEYREKFMTNNKETRFESFPDAPLGEVSSM